MKLHGKKVQTLNTEVVVIPRAGDEQYVFRAQAVLDYSDFEKLCPEPMPKTRIHKDGRKEVIADDSYKDRVTEWHANKIHWMILRSLEATEGLEWESVDMDDPKTFANYEKEFHASGFAPAEVNAIIGCVTKANSLDTSKIEAATKRFLASEAGQVVAVG